MLTKEQDHRAVGWLSFLVILEISTHALGTSLAGHSLPGYWCSTSSTALTPPKLLLVFPAQDGA